MNDNVTRRTRLATETQPMRAARPLRYAVRSAINQREKNEDSFYLGALSPSLRGEPLYLLAIADGMGGHEHGEKASHEALRKLNQSLCESLVTLPRINHSKEPVGSAMPNAATLRTELMNALKLVNDRILQIVASNRWEKAGATLVAALLSDDLVVAVNLGDSPLFHYRAGTLTQMTEDHNIAGAMLRAGMISSEMARHHEGRSRLEFHLGSKELPATEPVHQFTLKPGDALLLCSDGVSGRLTPQQMAEIIRSAAGDLERAADQLLAAAVAAGETDNQTLILWQHQ
jgi:protein phosphatase